MTTYFDLDDSGETYVKAYRDGEALIRVPDGEVWLDRDQLIELHLFIENLIWGG